MLSAPTSTAPFDSSRAISVPSRLAGARSRLIFEPASVGSPAMSNKFLTANGTPASAPSRRPRARSASSAAALASARSSVTAVNALSTRSCFAIRSSAARTTATALTRPLQTAAAISLAYAQAVFIRSAPLDRLGRKDRRRLGVVRQREIRKQGRERERHFEIGFDRALPCRLELKIERARRRVDEAVEEIALGNFAAPLGEHRPGAGFCSCARRLSFAFARFGSLGHLRSAPKSLHRSFPRKRESSLNPTWVPAFAGTNGTAILHPLREGRVGNGGQEVASILRLRRNENLVGRPLLDDASRLHDDDPIAQQPHHVEIVGDE